MEIRKPDPKTVEALMKKVSDGKESYAGVARTFGVVPNAVRKWFISTHKPLPVLKRPSQEVCCSVCGTVLLRKPSAIEVNKTGIFFCSRECEGIHKSRSAANTARKPFRV